MVLSLIFVSFLCLFGAKKDAAPPHRDSEGSDWPAYGRDAGGSRYSPLNQINRDNVKKLKVVWTYRTGDVADGSRTAETSQFEATPIMVDGMLYLSTPFNRVIALDPATGTERWTFDPKLDLSVPYGDGLTSRGVSAWLDRTRATREPCRRRIFVATNDGRLIALDGATGKTCADFGKDGQIELTRGVGPFRPGEYHFTSPPAIAGDLVVVGSAVEDGVRADAPSGVVRAFDARSGTLRWSWNPIPHDQTDPAWKTWKAGSATHTGAANVWSIMSVDAERDLIFLPTSCPSPDFYGGERRGDNLYSSSVVALRASTGKLVWYFQVVHHDVWDYDVPAQPVLVNVRRSGHEIPAVVVATKMGHIFVLNRETGKPLFPVEERRVPQGAPPGEELSPTQPFPVLPVPLHPQTLTPKDAWGVTEEDRRWCRERIESLRSEGIFTPPSLQGSVIYPGSIGGVAWGGVSVDPQHSIVIANTNRFPFVITLIPRERYEAEMKAHPNADIAPQTGTPYAMRRDVLRTRSGVLCNAPPWGTLSAINLSNARVRWQVPLGTVPKLSQLPGSSAWGSPSLGGSIVTAGGLVFIAAAMDQYLRAFDVETGEELWKGALPAGGQATPMTYRSSDGKQYVVIAAGGHGRLGTTLGDYVIAFALPH
ncbi:MAG TPA: pyrroloquinoline quinone-dependent dehydrogenase [Pyrinomonadaceae bacterium]|nr:pyrroloquinoline quinone-dependent dehydrogenase [Pyrinomonadaceae bacterium]